MSILMPSEMILLPQGVAALQRCSRNSPINTPKILFIFIYINIKIQIGMGMAYFSLQRCNAATP